MNRYLKQVLHCIIFLFALGLGGMAEQTVFAAGNWYEDYTYMLQTSDASGDNYLMLREYNGSASTLYVPATTVVDGVSYQTKLSPGENGIWYGTRNKLKEITFENGCIVADGGFLFYKLSKLESVNVEALDMSQATSTAWMFSECKNLTKLNVENWDLTNVTNMFNMFGGCEKLTSLDVSKWNTSNVTVMVSVFDHCKSLYKINVDDWDVSKVTTMSSMFYKCEKLDSLDLHKWNTSNVTDMWEMFGRCYSLSSVNVKGWDTSKVTAMAGMFGCNYNLTTLDLSSFDMTNVKFDKYDDQMFLRCASLQMIKTPKKTTQKLYFNSGLTYVKKNDGKTGKKQYKYIPKTNKSITMVCKQSKSKSTTFISVKSSGGKIKLKWKKVSSKPYIPVQYEIQCSTNEKFTNAVGKMSNTTDATYSVQDNVTNKTSTTIKGLTKGKTYYVRVRVHTYEKRLSNWSKVKKIKVK